MKHTGLVQNHIKKFLNYFNPKFLLGMTATPDRTDGYDIFTHFDHNIAYEISCESIVQQYVKSISLLWGLRISW